MRSFLFSEDADRSPESFMLLPFEAMLTNPYQIYVAAKGFARKGNIAGHEESSRMSRQFVEPRKNFSFNSAMKAKRQ